MKNDVCSQFGCSCDVAEKTGGMFIFETSLSNTSPQLKPKILIQHVHWTSDVHFQQNFIEAKEKSWVFDSSD